MASLQRLVQMTARMGREVVDVARNHVTTWHNPYAAAPKHPGALSVATWNIKLGGEDLPGVTRELKARQPDVVCLQETSDASARKLAHGLGMHLVLSRNGKAVLSRYPVTATKNVNFAQDWGRGMQLALKSGSTEPLQVRSALCVTLNVNGQKVDVLDTHLSLQNTAQNSQQMRALTRLVEARRAEGHSVVLAGDFNSNLALAEPGVDAPHTRTDTRDEWLTRYGKTGTPGNIFDQQNLRAARGLLGQLDSAWETTAHRSVRTGRGELTPEQAAARLLRSDLRPEERLRLQRVVDGLTHLGAKKRFDQLLVSPDVFVKSTTIDQSTHASDHQPVFTELKLPR